MENYKKKGFTEIKRELKLSYNDIAEMFGYKDGPSFCRSSRRKYIEKGIANLYNRVIDTTE